MVILKFIYFVIYFGALLPKMLLYFKYRVNHLGIPPKIPIYLDMNVSSMEEFCCISFLNAPTCNEIPMEYPVPNMLLKLLNGSF